MLQAEIDGKWGPIPKELLPEIPAEGTVSVYEFVYSFPDFATKKKSWQNHVMIHPISKIRDKKGRIIRIGLVGGIDTVGNLKTEEIRQLHFYPQNTRGRISIEAGKSAEQDELQQYLELTSQNESSPYRDTAVEPVIRKVDFVGRAKKDRADREKKRDAIGYAYSLKKDEDITRTALLLGIDSDRDLELVMNDIEKQAEENPDNFMQVVNDPNADIQVAYAEGMKNGNLVWDPILSQVKWGANNASIMQVANAGEAKSEFTNFVNKDGNGKTVYSQLLTLNGKNPAEDKPADETGSKPKK